MSWPKTTHDWAARVDREHLAAIRRDPAAFAPGGVRHLILDEWLIHANRRQNGSWTQRYEHGVPSTDLRPVADDGTTGTIVRFCPDAPLSENPVTAGEILRLTASWRFLAVEVDDKRTS